MPDNNQKSEKTADVGGQSANHCYTKSKSSHKNYISQLKKMQMYDTITVASDGQMQRVPGGWIYHAWNEDTGHDSSVCFIPFDFCLTDPLMNV